MPRISKSDDLSQPEWAEERVPPCCNTRFHSQRCNVRSLYIAKMQASMLQKKAFAGKPLAAKPVQVRSMGSAIDTASASWIARLQHVT